MIIEKGKNLNVKFTQERADLLINICKHFNIDYENLSATKVFDDFLTWVNDTIVSREFIQKELNKLKNADDKKEDKPESSKELTISDKLSEYQKELINIFLKNPKVIERFKQENRGGHWNGVINPVNTEDQEINILNLLTGYFSFAAYKGVMQVYAIKPNDLRKLIRKHTENE